MDRENLAEKILEEALYLEFYTQSCKSIWQNLQLKLLQHYIKYYGHLVCDRRDGTLHYGLKVLTPDSSQFLALQTQYKRSTNPPIN